MGSLAVSRLEIADQPPRSVADDVAAIARKMALDASGGRMLTTRLVLSLRDTESNASAPEEEEHAEPRFTATEFMTLLSLALPRPSS